ncbi:hypothetical protein GH733_000500, partial [Mirounga leonina]
MVRKGSEHSGLPVCASLPPPCQVAVHGLVSKAIKRVGAKGHSVPCLILYGSPLLCHSVRKMSSQGEKSKPIKQSLKKPKLPEEFPDDINPVTKEKGGPRGPEPTRYGDWERKGR